MDGGVSDHTVTYRGQPISISARTRLWGTDVIVFMHGFGCSKEFFTGAFESAALQDYSLCSFDFPSHGASDVLDPGTTTIETYADIARQLIDGLSPKPTRVALVCHSMGGAVGLLTARALGICDSFVSVEGNLIREDCGIVSRNTATQPREEFVARGHADFVKSLLSSDDRSLRKWGEWYSKADSAGLHAIAQSLVDWSNSGRLLNYFKQMPTPHYIYGEQSEVEYLTPRLKAIKRWSIPDAGHFLMLDNPEAFYGAVGEVVASLAWRGPSRSGVQHRVGSVRSGRR